MGKNFRDTLNEQLKDPTFRAEWEALEPERQITMAIIDGKKYPRNTYAHSEEECEKQLAEMIIQMKAEIATEKERLRNHAKAG